MGKTEAPKSRPRKSVNLPPKKSNAKKTPNVKRVYAVRQKQFVRQSVANDKKQQLSPSTSASLESSSNEADGSGQEDDSKRSKLIKKPAKRQAHRPSLLSRMRNYYDVSLNSTVTLSNLGQEDIAFLFEKSNRTLEDDLNFCEFKLNELNDRQEKQALDLTRTTSLTIASDSVLSGSPNGLSIESSAPSSTATKSIDEATCTMDSRSLVPYALSSDEEA